MNLNQQPLLLFSDNMSKRIIPFAYSDNEKFFLIYDYFDR